jgi:lysozyme family protein
VAISLTAALRREYETLFETCRIRPQRMAFVERMGDDLLRNRSRYDAVEEQRGVPWHFVAVVHHMESGCDFSCHLHNGDPLSARTVRVPAGRPRTGSPPFRWEESAADAMALKHLGSGTDWSLAGTLYQLERYNGWGYRKYHPHVLSPYLWSFSEHYDSGKYVADGRWSESAVSRQCGAAVLLRRLAEKGAVDFAGQPAAVVDPDTPGGQEERDLLVSTHRTRRASRDDEVERDENLQRWLNTFPGIFLRVDGIPGDSTSAAYRRVTGVYLPGDPRGA